MAAGVINKHANQSGLIANGLYTPCDSSGSHTSHQSCAGNIPHGLKVQELFPNLPRVSGQVVATVGKPNEPSREQRNQNLQALLTEFKEVFNGVCRPMVGPPCHFTSREGATPVAIRGSRQVSELLLPLLKAELEQLEGHGIIRWVTERTAFIHSIVVVPNKGGEYGFTWT